MMCPMCGSDEVVFKAPMGRLIHSRCRQCGIDYSQEATMDAPYYNGDDDRDELDPVEDWDDTDDYIGDTDDYDYYEWPEYDDEEDDDEQ